MRGRKLGHANSVFGDRFLRVPDENLPQSVSEKKVEPIAEKSFEPSANNAENKVESFADKKFEPTASKTENFQDQSAQNMTKFEEEKPKPIGTQDNTTNNNKQQSGTAVGFGSMAFNSDDKRSGNFASGFGGGFGSKSNQGSRFGNGSGFGSSSQFGRDFGGPQWTYKTGANTLPVSESNVGRGGTRFAQAFNRGESYGNRGESYSNRGESYGNRGGSSSNRGFNRYSGTSFAPPSSPGFGRPSSSGFATPISSSSGGFASNQTKKDNTVFGEYFDKKSGGGDANILPDKVEEPTQQVIKQEKLPVEKVQESKQQIEDNENDLPTELEEPAKQANKQEDLPTEVEELKHNDSKIEAKDDKRAKILETSHEINNTDLHEKFFEGLNEEKPFKFFEFKVHEEIVNVSKTHFAARSAVFQRLLQQGSEESKAIDVSDLSLSAVKQFAKYVHLGRAETFDADLLSLAKKYEIDELKKICSKHAPLSFFPNQEEVVQKMIEVFKNADDEAKQNFLDYLSGTTLCKR